MKKLVVKKNGTLKSGFEKSSVSTQHQSYFESLNIFDYQNDPTMGPIAVFRTESQKVRKKLQANEVIYNTQIRKLKAQGDAEVEEVACFWNAKAAEICEQIKTKSQKLLVQHEIVRAENRNDTRLDAVIRLKSKVDEIEQSNLPDEDKTVLKSLLLKDLQQVLSSIDTARIAKDNLLV